MIVIQNRANILGNVLERITRWINYIAMGGLTLMMFFISVDVLLRYAFNNPILGDQELIELTILVVVVMSIGYCGLKKGHIVVDIFFTRLPERKQTIFNIFHYFIGSIVFGLVCWRTVMEGMMIQARGMTSSVLYIPVYPFFWVVAFGSGVLCLAWLQVAIKSLAQAIKSIPAKTPFKETNQ